MKGGRGKVMTNLPDMKLPDILAQYLRKDRTGTQGSGKAYDPVQPGQVGRDRQPIRPKGGASRTWPFLLGLALIAVVFAVSEFIRDSEPFKIASSFVRESPAIRDDLGEIKEISPWLPVSLQPADNSVRLRLTLRIKGSKGTGKAFISLVHLNNWQITAVVYENRQGRWNNLMPGKIRSEAPLPAPAAGGDDMAAGHRLFRQNDFSQAVAAYDRALVADPNNSAALYWRGRAYYKMNRPDKAAADFSKTVALNPKHAEAYNWLGWLAEQEKRYDDCIGHLTRAVTLKTDNSWGYYHRGRCYYQQGKRKEARQDAEQSCRLGYEQACKTLKQLP